MHEHLYPVPKSFAETAQVKRADYEQLYAQSLADPEGFWGRIGRRIDWIREFSRVKDTSFAEDDCHIRWFYDGKLNVSSNCLDRHLHARADKTAIIWESDDPNRAEHISYRQLHERVCQCANALKSLGIEKGDRVTIYLPMIPELAISMLACARIGAIHSVVFAGFSSEALGGRIADCDSRLVITADEGLRGGKRVPLKQTVDEALTIEGTECVQRVLVVRRTGASVPMYSPRDQWYDDAVAQQAKTCSPAVMDAEDPLFILYTSGSTGQAQRRAAHQRGLSRLRRIHAPDRVRFARGGHLLGDRGHRLGHRAQLHRLWSARQWGDHRHVRRGAELSGPRPLLAGRRQAQGHDPVLIADRHSLAHARRRKARQGLVSPIVAVARLGGRADQSGSVGVVLPRGRR